MNILFLSVSAGGGHSKTAEVIKEYIELNYPDSKSQIVDTYRYVSPVLDKLVIGSYLKTLKLNPKLWGKIYNLAEKDENTNDIMQKINKILSYKIKKFIREFKPDILICTHPFPLQMVCEMKKKNAFDIPIVNIITDYSTHSFWIDENVDAYIVAHEMLIYEMTEKGVPREKIFPLGLPVSQKFLIKREKSELLKHYDLEDKLTFLLMGGSLGMGEIKKLFIKLLESDLDFQIIIVCGKNQKLKKQIEKLYTDSNLNKKAVILGFTNSVHELMTISDWIITKPGGLTVTEAVLMTLPIVIMSPLPGQEEINTNYLLNNGLGVKLENINNFERLYHQYLNNPLRIKQIKEMSLYLSKPNATTDIVNFLYDYVKNRVE